MPVFQIHISTENLLTSNMHKGGIGMTINEVRERVTEIIKDGTEYEGILTSEMNLIDEIGLSSLESMVLIGELESEFGIELPIDEVKQVSNIGWSN